MFQETEAREMMSISMFWSLYKYMKKEKNSPSQHGHLTKGEFLELTLGELAKWKIVSEESL